MASIYFFEDFQFFCLLKNAGISRSSSSSISSLDPIISSELETSLFELNKSGSSKSTPNSFKSFEFSEAFILFIASCENESSLSLEVFQQHSQVLGFSKIPGDIDHLLHLQILNYLSFLKQFRSRV